VIGPEPVPRRPAQRREILAQDPQRPGLRHGHTRQQAQQGRLAAAARPAQEQALAREAYTDGDGVPQYVEREFRRYLECGSLAHGFARAHCGDCGHDFLIAFSCKGRAVCLSCNARHMAQAPEPLANWDEAPAPVPEFVFDQRVSW
jgi:hypothetical protein